MNRSKSTDGESTIISVVPRLESILNAVGLEELSCLQSILQSNIDSHEKQVVRDYIHLVESLRGRPSTSILNQQFPGMNFELEPVNKTDIHDYIQLYLYHRRNLEISKELTSASTTVRTEGLTEKVRDTLNDITKSDVVRHKFVNIKESIIERYEKDEYSKRNSYRCYFYRRHDRRNSQRRNKYDSSFCRSL